MLEFELSSAQSSRIFAFRMDYIYILSLKILHEKNTWIGRVTWENTAIQQCRGTATFMNLRNPGVSTIWKGIMSFTIKYDWAVLRSSGEDKGTQICYNSKIRCYELIYNWSSGTRTVGEQKKGAILEQAVHSRTLINPKWTQTSDLIIFYGGKTSLHRLLPCFWNKPCSYADCHSRCSWSFKFKPCET